ncbi:hypothetical protein [uncultured Draconibacterium sp.]|uniref:hypothetical protein n=1 Tax=uncultured Draconibacterium sp. TaxID=1573823 RepID=UPI0029C0935D|nr:hypothetical protein [uncultured Draconibacterium sp.]
MKNTLLLLLIIPALLFSCDKVDELNTIEFDTTLSMDIPVAVVEPTAQIAKSGQAEFTFSQTQTTRLSDIDEISDYLNKLKSIAINDMEIAFSNLGEGEEIISIEISVTGAGTIVTLNNISATNNVQNPDIDNAVLMQAATILNATKEIELTVSGTTNTAPMGFIVNMDFDCHIEAEAI